MFIIATAKHVNITYSLGDLAEWFSAIGTFLAVVVSLYLANRRKRPKILLLFEGANARGKQQFCRIVNKSPFPVEFKIKLPPHAKYYTSYPLEPLSEKIKDLKDTQPFNNDFMTFPLTDDEGNVFSSNAFDVISDSKYYFVFYIKNDHWKVKQYRFYLLWKLMILWWTLYERF